MTRVKICGIRRLDDALVAAKAGAEMLGFVFAPSRRAIDPEIAREIVAAVRRRASVKMVGVFVNATPDDMNRIGEQCDLDYLQLSGDEGEDTVEQLHLPVIKTIHIHSDTAPGALIKRVDRSRAAIIHLDTARAGAYGGTGVTFEWARVPYLDRPVLLAGGLHADNVQDAIRAVNPWGVDVSSGVETDSVKDQAKIKAFITMAISGPQPGS